MSPRIIRGLIVSILLIPLWSLLLWAIRPVRPINIFILDKTVSDEIRDEHRSFSWILFHEKFARTNRKFYRSSKDYWGLFPVQRGGDFNTADLDSITFAQYDPTKAFRPDAKSRFNYFTKLNFTVQQIDSLAEELDMVYFTDMYGIYNNDWFSDTITWKERSTVIYGGISLKELYLLKRMKAQHKLIIAEFNFYHNPTQSNIREAAGKLINSRWTGWVGRYFDPLDTIINKELPKWVRDGYMRLHGGVWPFKRAGIVFADEHDNIEILEDTTDLNVKIPFIYTSQYGQKKFNMIDSVHYPFWFDISLPLNDSNTIVSTFRIDPNERGDSILRHWNIPSEFPAVMESTGPSPYYYFGADFCDNPIKMRPAFFAGSGMIDFAFYDDTYLLRTKFFYALYRPMMQKIMNDYYRSLRR